MPRVLTSKTKNATLVTLDDSGHVSMIENPDGFKNAMKNFLQTLAK